MSATLPQTTINTLQGAVTLAAGANVGLTPAGNTITVSATAPAGAPTVDYFALNFQGGY